jgi:hypothetical protein
MSNKPAQANGVKPVLLRLLVYGIGLGLIISWCVDGVRPVEIVFSSCIVGVMVIEWIVSFRRSSGGR